MVWVGISFAAGMMDITVINGTLNQDNYLNDVLIPNVLPYKQAHPDMIFQHYKNNEKNIKNCTS